MTSNQSVGSFIHIRSSTYIFCHLRSLLVTTVEYLLVFIHPDLSQPHLVASNHLRTFGESVRALSAENMADNGAWDDFQLSTTLPHLPFNRKQHQKMHHYMQLDTPLQLSPYWKEVKMIHCKTSALLGWLLTLNDISIFSPPQISISSS